MCADYWQYFYYKIIFVSGDRLTGNSKVPIGVNGYLLALQQTGNGALRLLR